MFWSFTSPLLLIFNVFLQTNIFSDKLKIAGVTALFKGVENNMN